MNKKEIYDHYLENIFNKAHDSKKINREYRELHKYFKKNYLKYLPKDKNARILDLGCGKGHFLYFLRKEGYQNYLGIDTSKEGIEFCSEKKFNVLEIDAFKFFKNNTAVDVIAMNDIIEHFKKEEIVILLKKIYLSLNKGGILLIKTLNMANPITAAGGRYIDITHEVCFTEESLRQVCIVGGFKTVKIMPLDIYVFYYNPLNYLAKSFSLILNRIFRLLFLLHGRKTTTIFTKNILAICRK